VKFHIQHQWSINVWCGIVNDLLIDYIIGLHFFNGILTGAMYNDFLQNTLPQPLEDVDLATRQCLWMQQDSAPSHYARNVRNTLNQMFLNSSLDRKGWLCKLVLQITRSNTIGFFLFT